MRRHETDSQELVPPITGRIGLAALAALLFAVHPVVSEAVCEVSYREDLLVTFFILLGLLMAERFPVGCVFALLCAVGAKESGVAGPPVLLLYWWLFRRDQPRRRWVALIGVAFLVVGAFLAARFALQPKHSVIFTTAPTYPGGSFGGMLKLQPRFWAFHLRNIVWPADLCADYGPYSLRHFYLNTSLVVLAMVVAGQVWLAWRNRLALWGAAFFWLALLPVSNLMPIYRPIADRYLYLPMVGVCVWLMAIAPWRQGKPVLVVWLTVCAVLLPVTWRREMVGQDSRSLWSDTLERNIGSMTAANNLGYAMFDAGQTQEAMKCWRRALQLTKNQLTDAWAGLALGFEAQGRHDEADRAYREAIARDNRYLDPEQLLKALIIEPYQLERLRPLAARNRPL